MSSQKSRDFEPAADVLTFGDDDDKIAQLARRKGITDHSQAVRALEVSQAAPTTAAEKQVALTVMVPESVRESIRLADARGEGTARFQVLAGLRAAGNVAVTDEMLVQDRRSTRKTR